MKKLNFKAKTGQEFSVRIPKPANIESVFVFSIFKSGSTLLNNIVRDLCACHELPTIDLVSDAYCAGVRFRDIDSSIEQVFQERGFIYLGFRNFFQFKLKFDFQKVRKILLVRDPRDILVSLFFSQKHSHAMPLRGGVRKHLIEERRRAFESEIDTYVLNNADYVALAFDRYLAFARSNNTKLYCYEEIIYNKREWIRDIASYLNVEVKPEHMAQMLDIYDVFPDIEDPHEHIRQVKPGNYKEHLSQECIDKLNGVFADIVQYYGYQSK